MILSVTASNFRSYESFSYVVERPGLVVVSGSWQGVASRSNGSGKSSLIDDAICWAIYGELVRGKKQVCRRGATSCSVTVQTPACTWTRSQKADGTGNTIKIQGVEHRKFDDAKDYLLKIFPPKKIFVSTIVLGQGVGERFTAWPPGVRFQVLADLLNLGIWSDARSNLLKRRSSVANELSSAQGQLKSIETSLRQLQESYARKPEISTEQIRSDLRGVTAELEELTKAIGPARADCERVSKQFYTLEAEKRQSTTELAKVMAELGRDPRYTVCPTCKRPFDYDEAAVTARIRDLKSEEQKYRSAIFRLESDEALLRTESTEASKRMAAVEADKQRWSDECTRLKEWLSAAEVYEATRKKYQQGIDELNARIKELSGRTDRLEVLSRAFHEIPFCKLDDAIAELNEHMAAICESVWDGEFAVALTTETQHKSGTTSSEIQVEVSNPAGDYEGSSGGQQRDIDLTVQLALRQMLVSYWPTALPLLICDDITDVLDYHAQTQFMSHYVIPASGKSAVFILSPSADQVVDADGHIQVVYTPKKGSWIDHYTDKRASTCPVLSNVR